jgi:hypothetical protein
MSAGTVVPETQARPADRVVRRTPTRTVLPPFLPTTAALASIGEAVAHVPVIEPHLVEAPYIGVGFVLLTVAGFYLAVRLVVDPDELVWATVGVVAVLAVVGYVLSRSVGLPQIGDDVGAWADPLGITAVSCELLMLAAAAAHGLARTRA